jgi:hypothetical protein
MFFTGAYALALSAFGMAPYVVNGARESSFAVSVSGTTKNTMIAYTLQRLLEEVEHVYTQAELQALCGLTDEKLQGLRELIQ